jgi:hypothetical protein
VQFIHEANKINVAGSITSTEEKTSLHDYEDDGVMINVEANEKALDALISTKPLEELISPFKEQISTGLSNMGKLVGSSTKPSDVTPGNVATFLSITQQYEQDVVLPLQKLNGVVSTREKYLNEVMRNQLDQIKQLKQTLDCLKQRKKVTD